MLVKQSIIAQKDGQAIVRELVNYQQDLVEGKFQLSAEAGDIHENVEKKLIERLGQTGKQFHTARSRNDQICTDSRLYWRRNLLAILEHQIKMQQALFALAETTTEVVMPGYTHLQHAQPMTFGFWIMSYASALQRDTTRLIQTLERFNSCPLGAGASFGVTYPIDRQYTANLLGFADLEYNCLDSISNRGEDITEALADLAFVFQHLGRLANELILFASCEYGFIKIGDQFTSGSSIMPQKKNQDVLELIRSKSASLNARLLEALTIGHNLPSGYNRDQRITKESLALLPDLVDTLAIFTALVPTITPQPASMLEAVNAHYSTATDLADALVHDYAIAFRDAHLIVGKLVKLAIDQDILLANLSPQVLQDLILTQTKQNITLSPDFIRLQSDPASSVQRRQHAGATAPRQILSDIKHYRQIHNQQIIQLKNHQKNLEQAEKNLESEIRAMMDKVSA